MKKYLTLVCIATLAGCTAENDMQGVDPIAYYDEHPIENKVEPRQLSQLVQFPPGQGHLSPPERDRLRDSLHGVSPLAADTVIVQLPKAELHNVVRKDDLILLLRHLGYGKIPVQFEPSDSLAAGTAQIDMHYTALVSPNCPDWRLSPVTTYSNGAQGNMRCATTVNSGLMIADPHDLARGTGDVTIDTERSSKTVQDYNGGKDFMPGTMGAGSSGNGGSSGGSGASSGVSGMNSSTSGGASGVAGAGGGTGAGQ